MTLRLHATSPVCQNWNTLREMRRGIMLHYDDSSSDAGALAWLTADPACRVSYNLLITDDGTVHVVAPLDKRAWHAGICRPSDYVRLTYEDANSALYGVAIAARAGERATPAQVTAVLDVCRFIAGRHGWDLRWESWRIVGHDSEAWPRGRKIDPTGPDRTRPVLDVAAVRAAFQPPPPPAVAA